MAQPSIPGTEVGIPRMVYGNDGTDWIAVLVDALGHIQADILSTVLPSDAATQTTLAACLTALQLIDDLRNALGSVNTDDLQVDVKTSALPTDAAKETKQDTMITALQLIDDLRNALGSVNTDDLQVDVKTSALPTNAAKETKQDTMITALQLIDDLRNALGSVATDLVRVESEDGDKIEGFESIVEEEVVNLTLAAGTNLIDGAAVPAGKIWRITQAGVYYLGTVTNVILLLTAAGLATALPLLTQSTVASGIWYPWSGEIYLQAGDLIRFTVYGATLNDDARLRYAGVQMNAP